ncbi:MAG TPA: hypothetical protein DEV81_13430 [Cyanobacteria bacterium UBA11049]|nr:hypothetical protein [Cyanobacteria bacterium UBA11049]
MFLACLLDERRICCGDRVWSKLVGERLVLKPNRNMAVFAVLKKAYLSSISLELILNQIEST